MSVSVSTAIEIAAPIDDVYRWLTDDAYSTLWDSSTISRGPGFTIRRRGKDLRVLSERLHFNRPAQFVHELDIEGAHELMQYDLAPTAGGTWLTVTSGMLNPDQKTRERVTAKPEIFQEAFYAELELIKSLVERGGAAAAPTPIDDEMVNKNLKRMSPHGRMLWTNSSPNARRRAIQAATSGTNASNPAEAQMAYEYTGALLEDLSFKAYAKVIGLALLTIAFLVYAVLHGRPVSVVVALVFLGLDVKVLLAKRRVQGVIETSHRANKDYLEQSSRVEAAIARMPTADEYARAAIIDELASFECTNSLNRRAEVALERLAAHADPATAARATAALAARQGRINAEIQRAAA